MSGGEAIGLVVVGAIVVVFFGAVVDACGQNRLAKPICVAAGWDDSESRHAFARVNCVKTIRGDVGAKFEGK